MSLILMLHQLTQITKRPVALVAAVREVRNPTVIIAVSYHRPFIQEPVHGTLLLCKLINLLSSVIPSATTDAVSTFDVLYCIRSTSEPLV